MKTRLQLTLLGVIVALCGLLAPAAALGSPHAPGELVVKYRLGTSAAERAGARTSAGVRAEGAIDERSETVRVGAGDDISATARKLESDPRVVHAVPNYLAKATAFTPNDPGKTGPGGWSALQWNFTGPFGIRLQDAWQHAIDSGNAGGRGVVVAVLDTGVAYRTSPDRRFLRAPDLDRKRFVRGHDFIRGDQFPYDRNGHGTFVAGVIGQSTNNGIGVAGIAYGSRIMPVRVLDARGYGEVSTIARGIRFAARHGAKVINMSFEFEIGLTASEIPDVMSAIRKARRSGVLLVAAAGNTEDSRVAYPARARQVLAVGATTEHGCLAEYSNTGPGLDLVAPGGGADAALDGDPACRPLEEPGRDIYQYTFQGASPRRFGLPSGYEGTSMAVPHAVGVAALVIGSGVLGPDPSPTAVAQRLQTTVQDLGAPGYDSTYGWGLLNAAAATAPL